MPFCNTRLVRVFFLIYFASAFVILFVYTGEVRVEQGQRYSPNLVPMKETYKGIAGIFRHKKYRWHYFSRSLRQYGGNILLFVPLGYFFALNWPFLRKYYLVAFSSALASLLVEFNQWLWALGLPDIDDVILNTLGGVTGFWVFLAICKQRRK